MSITHISKSETLKNNRLETGHIFLLISLLDKKCIHLAIFYCPCSMNLSPIPLSIQSMPFCIALPWYHMPIVWMTHCNMLIVWLPLYLYANNPGQGKTRPRTPSHALTRPHTPSALIDPKPHALSRLWDPLGAYPLYTPFRTPTPHI